MSYIYNKVKTIGCLRMLWLLVFQWMTLTLLAQPADSVKTYTKEHPLVYEDAWDLWPYSFLNEDGEPVGYNIDLLHMIFSKLDIPYIIRLKPTSVALNDLKEGRSDLMCGMDANFHNDYGKYGKSVIQIFTHSIAHQKGREELVKSLQDLSRYRVIVHTNSFSHHLMMQRGWGKNAIPYDDMREAVQRAHNDPNRQIVWNTMSLKWLIQTMHYDNLELSPLQIPHGEYKFMSNDPHLLHQLDSVFSEINFSSSLQAIQNKWFYPEHKESVIPSWIWLSIVGMLLLVVMGVAYYVIYRRQEKKMTYEVRLSNSRLALILKTSRVHIWILHVATKTVTQFDDRGVEQSNELSAREFFHFVHPADMKHLIGALNNIVSQRHEQQTIDIRTNDDDGSSQRNLTIELAVLRYDKNGQPADIIGTTSDVTEAHLRQLQTKDNMLRYQSIFDSTLVDAATFNAKGYITDMNDSCARLLPYGKKGSIAIGVNLKDLLGDDLPPLDELQFMHMTRVYTNENDARVFNSKLHPDRMYYELQLVPIRNAAGKLLMVFATGRDVTEMVSTYQKLKANAQQMEQANEEMKDYISNVDYVLTNGGVRTVFYWPNQDGVTIYSGIGQPQYQLTKARALALTDEESKEQVQQLFDSMDGQTKSSMTASVKTRLRTRNHQRLSLYFSFVPTIEDGEVTGYFGMCRDISEIKATEDQLAIETKKAQEVEEVKSAFLRNMSYEIRTPLNSVVGFAELFAMEHNLEDEPFFINEIKNNSARLLRLINDILYLSRLDAHMIEFKQEPVEFVSFLEARCHETWSVSHAEGVNLVIDKPFDNLVLNIDQHNLGIVIDQLLANAAEHTTQGTVHVAYEYKDEELQLSIQDTGSGIPEERLPNIFKRFGSANGRGTGLGLPICHEVVQQMNGKISIESEVGKGTTVWVRLLARLALFLLLFLPSGIANAAKNFYGYTEERPLTIACDWDFRPFEFVDKSGQPSGYNVEVLDLVLTRLEIPHRFVMVDWQEALHLFEIREADLIHALAYEFRIRPYVTTHKFVNYYTLAAVRKNNTPKATRLQQLTPDDVVAVREGDYAAREVESLDTIAFQLRYLPPKEGLLSVSTGQCDYYVWGREPMKQKIKELALDNLVLDDLDLPPGELRIVGYDNDIVDIIDDEYTRLEQEGELQRVYDKWFRPELYHDDSSPLTVAILIAMGAMLLVFVLMGALIHLRVKAAVRRNTDLKHMMEQALHMGDYYVLKYDVQTGHVYNAYNELLPPEGMSEAEFLSHFRTEELDDFFDHVASMKRGEMDEWTLRKFWNKGTDDEPNWHEYDGSAILEREDGEPRYIFHAFKDITREVREQQHNQEMTAIYMKVFETNLSPMSFYGADGKLIDFNQKMYELCEMQRGTEQAFRDGNLFDDPFSAPFIEQGARDTYHVCGRMYYPELGIDKYIESRTQPVFDDEGHQVYYVVTARDVTAEREMYMRQREHDRQLQQTNDRINSYEQQLRYLLVESKMWVWRFDLKTRRINFSRSLRQGEIDEPIRSYISRLSERFHGYANDNLRDIMRNGKPFRLIREFNDNILSGGGHSWNGISGIPLRDKDGKIYQYFGITRDISDLMAAQERLRQETARAEDSGRMKAAFLANMTHEIRTPLNAIVGFSDLLQEIDSAEERQEFIRIIRDNCDMLLRLINDILEASSMGQSLAIHPLKVDLPSIFDDICQTLAQRVQEPGVEFIKDNPLSDYPATLDRGRLQQMLTNFVTNAVKYTHQGHIKVGWRSEEREGIDGIYFYCEDTGAGIPQDKQASVFERFVKLNDFVQGTGLGLSICKAIVDKCGGHIGVTSEGEGHGSTFWFWIPRHLSETQ